MLLTLLAIALLSPAAPALPAPITLDDALAEAARQSPDLALARAQSDSAGVDAYASYAGVLPRLDLAAAFGRDFIGPQTTIQTVPVGLDASGLIVYDKKAVTTPAIDFADYSLGLTLQLPLFDGARSWNAIARARAAARSADRDLDEARLAVAFDVSRRFYEVVKAEESLRVLEETVVRSDELVRRADALFTAGRGPKSDASAARVNRQNDRIAVEAQRAHLAQVRADLAVALGRRGGAELAVVPPAPVAGPALPSSEEPPPEEALLERARRFRPLLASRAEAARAADLGVTVAKGAYWPVVGAQATYTRQGPFLSGAGGVYGDPSRQYYANAQIYVQWNLFQGRKTAADAESAEIQARRSRILADQAEQLVAAEITRARANVLALARSASLAQDSLSAAELGLALARQRLEAGAANQLEVRDASLKLTQAKLSLVDARIDFAVARADLSRAVGGAL
jgi:outer membrane protein TolC